METVQKLSQAYSQTPWRKQIGFVGLFLLSVVFLALATGVYLDVTARGATMGREIMMMQKQIEEARLVNADLETQLALLTSAESMEKRAQALGFEPVQKGQAVYLVVPGYQPLQQVRLAPPPAPVQVVAAGLPAEYTASLVDWLQLELMPRILQTLEVRR